MVEFIEHTGRILNQNNQGIVKYLLGIEEERNNLENIIKKQFEEKEQIESDIEKLNFKLLLINKSLAMRIKTKNSYDKTMDAIKVHFEQLVDSSNNLRQIVEKTQLELDNLMNKKIGTCAQSEEDNEIKILYVKSSANGDQPTKEESMRKSQEILKTINKKNFSESTIIMADFGENTPQANGKIMKMKIRKYIAKKSKTKNETICDNNNQPTTGLENTSGKVSTSTGVTSVSSLIMETGDIYAVTGDSWPEIKFVSDPEPSN